MKTRNSNELVILKAMESNFNVSPFFRNVTNNYRGNETGKKEFREEINTGITTSFPSL